jgi:hypothetical protein
MTAARPNQRHRALVPVLALVALGAGIVAMREATQSRHVEMPADSAVRVVIEPRSNRPESSQSIERVVTAHISFCQLEVGSEVVGDLRPVSAAPERFSFEMVPALDATDRKQFRGCLEDWIVDNHRIDVVSIDEVPAP